jgi:DNA (cytosine-5)-methyltransferase 1
MRRGGKGILIQDDQTGTLSTVNNQSVCYPINTMVASRNNNESRTTFGVGDNGEAQFTLSAAHEHAVCYGICSDKSNSMLSGNPHSGIYEADTSRTLDNNCGNPACNQGGIAVCYPEVSRTLSARHDSSPCIDRGQEFICYESE